MPPTECTRCGVAGEPLEDSVCGLCRIDAGVLAAVSDWCRSEAAREALQWGGESLAPALEYEMFMPAIEELAEMRKGPPDAHSGEPAGGPAARQER